MGLHVSFGKYMLKLVCIHTFLYILLGDNMKAIVAARGQITIPKIIRQQLGLKPGTVLELRLNGATLTAIKAEPLDAVKQVYGCLGKTVSTDNIIDILRGKN